MGCIATSCIIESTSSTFVGGIAGYGANTNSSAVFENCKAVNCVMKGSSAVGGIAGYGATRTAQPHLRVALRRCAQCMQRATMRGNMRKNLRRQYGNIYRLHCKIQFYSCAELCCGYLPRLGITPTFIILFFYWQYIL